MSVQGFLRTADRVSTWTGQLFAWLICVLMLVVCIEVFKRYILNAPTAWVFDLDAMLYGTLFMMCGAYTLAQDGHVRGDFLYGSMRPRTQASLDLALYFLFFMPGIVALLYAGYFYAADSWAINEHSNVTYEGPPVYPFKTIIPLAGVLVMFQGVAEIVRCVVCIRSGAWPERLSDVEEIDVVEGQLANSEYVDEESRREVIEKAHSIHDTAHQRGMGESRAIEEEAHGRLIAGAEDDKRGDRL
jgi:TRAP-type mannitol/chloroaromatic compound transport system permease small subunit